MRTPPGISPEVFAKALQEFSNAIGKDSVFASEDDIDLYRDSYIAWRAISAVPSGERTPPDLVRIAPTIKGNPEGCSKVMISRGFTPNVRKTFRLSCLNEET